MLDSHLTPSFEDGPQTAKAGQTFVGDAGDNTQAGTGGNDTFLFDQGGDDTLSGLGGNDTFNLGAAFTAADTIDGGGHNDTLTLSGDYSSQLVLSDSTLTSVETIRVAAGNSYSLLLAAANDPDGASLKFDAQALLTGDRGELDASEVAGAIDFIGGKGDDQLVAGAGKTTFTGGNGDDLISFDNSYSSADAIDGGKGDDLVSIKSLNALDIAFHASSLKNVEEVDFVAFPVAGGASYSASTVDDNVAAGATLIIKTVVAEGTVTSLDFNGSKETNGHFDITGGDGNDTLTGGALSDAFHIDTLSSPPREGGDDGGNDTVLGGGGDDTIFAGGALTADDSINGGAGNDTLVLNGDYSGGITFGAHTIVGVETIRVTAGNVYNLNLIDANIPKGETLTVDGSALGAEDSLGLDDRYESNGQVVAIGGAGGDILIGGAKSDTLSGGGGNDELIGWLGGDTLDGGGGLNTFNERTPADSTSVNYDTVIGFNPNDDSFGTENGVNAIDTTVGSGSLSHATFDADLMAAVGTGQLAAFDAVLFEPDAGDMAGTIFVIVDDNGQAGYQPGKDYVIELVDPQHLHSLSHFNFGPLVG